MPKIPTFHYSETYSRLRQAADFMMGTNVEELWPDLSQQITTTKLMLSEADKQDYACHKFEDKEMAKFFRQIDLTKSHDLVRGAVVCLIYASGWTGLATDAIFYLFVKDH